MFGQRNARSVLEQLESRLQTDSIRRRHSQNIDRDRIGKLCEQSLTQLRPSATQLCVKEVPDIAIGGLAIWDLAAFVATNNARSAFAIGVSIGAIRLFDLVNCCRWGIGSPDIPETILDDDSHIWQTWGSILYQYSTQRYHDLRHWMLDITIGRLIPYGLADVNLSSFVHPKLEYRQKTSLEVIIQFIVAHEFAHVMQGHMLNSATRRVTSLAGLPATISALDVDWKHEFDADLLAIKTMFFAESSLKCEVLRDVAFFFNTLATVERISTEPVFWGHSHPAPVDRLQNIIENIGNLSDSPVSPPEAEEMRAAARAFSYIPKDLGDWIIDSPGDFRKVSTNVLETYWEEIPDEATISRSAVLNNKGDEFLAEGKLDEALAHYQEAIRTLKGCSYGEGYRIVYNNLVKVNLHLQHPDQAAKWVVEGMNSAFDHRDRPAAIWLMRKFKDQIANNASGLTAQNLAALRAFRNKKDPKLTALIDTVFRRV